MRPRRSKYGARRTEYRGEVYDSAAEAAYAAHLDTLRRIGKIQSWLRGKPVILVDGPSRRERITYRPDFVVAENDGRQHAVDVKGAVPRDFRLRAILWRQKFPWLPLRIVNGRGIEIDIFAAPPRKLRRRVRRSA